MAHCEYQWTNSWNEKYRCRKKAKFSVTFKDETTGETTPIAKICPGHYISGYRDIIVKDVPGYHVADMEQGN